MDATEALRHFVGRALIARKAQRIIELLGQGSQKARQRIVRCLAHEFEPFVRPDAVSNLDYRQIGKLACYAFGDHAEFGQAFSTVLEAREFMALYDGWLLVTQNASAGVFRPESRWDDEMLILPDQPSHAK